MLRICGFLSIVMAVIVGLFGCGGGPAPVEEEEDVEAQAEERVVSEGLIVEIDFSSWIA